MTVFTFADRFAWGSLLYSDENSGSSAASATSDERCAPALSPIMPMRSGSTPSWLAFARTYCTAAFVSYTAPGQVFTPGFINRYSIANTAYPFFARYAPQFL